MSVRTAQPRPSAYDVAALRRDFPILATEVHGKPLVYLDNAALGAEARAVLDAMNTLRRSEYANVHRGVHFLSAAATERYEGRAARVQRFLNAAPLRRDRLHRAAAPRRSTSWLSAIVAPLIKPGDEIVLSVMEHHSNIVPWHFLRERQGAVLKWVDVSDDGELDPAVSRARSGRKTKLVAISHMSNVLGTKTAARRRSCASRTPRACPVLADGCQAAVHGASTCRRSTSISTPSPATSFTVRPGSACSTASAKH